MQTPLLAERLGAADIPPLWAILLFALALFHAGFTLGRAYSLIIKPRPTVVNVEVKNELLVDGEAEEDEPWRQKP